jgi:uncharacterized membrane protein
VFDVIAGLPVHALVVHVVVVLLPLMALVTLAFTVRARWRPGLPWAILGNVLVLGACYTAKQSGEKLQARLSGGTGRPVAEWHRQLGENLPYFAIGLLIASVLAYLLTRGTSSKLALSVAVVIVLAAGGAATVWTYRVGDSGARAVWETIIANTTAPG